MSVCEKPLEGTGVLQHIEIGIKCINTDFYASFKDVLECITKNQEIEEREGWLKQHNPKGLWDFLMQV